MRQSSLIVNKEDMQRKSPLRWNECSGLSGANGNRNHDLFDANEALYQLSYSPIVLQQLCTLYYKVRKSTMLNQYGVLQKTFKYQ